MDAITLWQPWATWIEWGEKTIETRIHNRFKSLVGKDICIHSAKRPVQKEAFYVAKQFNPEIVSLTHGVYPRGYLLCVVHVDRFKVLSGSLDENKKALCRTDGLYGLFLSNIRPIPKPIPWKGSQGIFKLPDEIIKTERLYGA